MSNWLFKKNHLISLQHVNRITGVIPHLPNYMEFKIKMQPVRITFCCLRSCTIITHVGVFGGYRYPLAPLFVNTIIAFIIIISLHLINGGGK
jgi:hypothetical protein